MPAANADSLPRPPPLGLPFAPPPPFFSPCRRRSRSRSWAPPRPWPRASPPSSPPSTCAPAPPCFAFVGGWKRFVAKRRYRNRSINRLIEALMCPRAAPLKRYPAALLPPPSPPPPPSSALPPVGGRRRRGRRGRPLARVGGRRAGGGDSADGLPARHRGPRHRQGGPLLWVGRGGRWAFCWAQHFGVARGGVAR